MANWIIDTGNNKRGFYFSTMQDVFKNAVINLDGDGNPVASMGDGSDFAGTQSTRDPRNMLIHETTEDGVTTVQIGPINQAENVSVPLELDAVKNFLDTHDATMAPMVMLQYQFASSDEKVTPGAAIQGAKYVGKTNADGVMKAVDILDSNSVIWEAPNKKDVVNYIAFGKLNGLPNTYYMLLNSFRTELYHELQDTSANTFIYLDQATGGMRNAIMRPSFTNAKLLDNDIIIASNDSVTMNIFNDEAAIFNSSTGITTSNIDYTVDSNASITDNGSGTITIDMTGREVAYISITVASDIFLPKDPRLSIQRTFTVHK
jgi:hypothetical protein